MLDKIPADVILLVTEHIRHKRDLNSLSQASKNFHTLLTPILYRSITLAADECDIQNLNIGSILKYSTDYLRFVKNLEITAFFHLRLRTRCPRNGDYEGESSEEDEIHEENDAMSLGQMTQSTMISIFSQATNSVPTQAKTMKAAFQVALTRHQRYSMNTVQILRRTVIRLRIHQCYCA
ncbi:hypothetical protein P170DRAFT_43422 [Aspergillus steynii IBT 23096]|uniref:F-box domain-containing protein n=1 Tax=Aspergillus steynii IBT 23096 TaxID=1392250 RepID=A0A2I2GRP7_9EURO|nr:uncharacterized protein P170DRAFT_43422 [Aspergillus steynii IBT 23096]PLB55550.1 hypothetical protein P170DRAFT_43422 [Aspergillus steynii IBT 23096]